MITTVQPKMDSQFSGEPADYFMGARYYTIPVDREDILKRGVVEDKFAHRIANEVVITMSEPAISRSTLMIYDLLAHNNWQRPICFTQPHLMNDFKILDYARYDGMCYSFVPVETTDDYGYMDIDKLYPMFIDECEEGAINQALQFGNIADSDVLVDYFVRYNNNSSGLRGGFSRVANGFIERAGSTLQPLSDSEIRSTFEMAEIDSIVQSAVDDLVKAESLLDRGLKVLPPSKLGYEYRFVMPYIRGYYDIAMTLQDNDLEDIAQALFTKGDNLNIRYVADNADWVNYYLDYGDSEGFTPEIVDKVSTHFEDVLDGVTAARSVGSYKLVANAAFNFEYLADKYIRMLDRELPSKVPSEVAKANTKMVADGGRDILKYIADKEIRVWVSKVLTLYHYLFDQQGYPYGVADAPLYVESLYNLMDTSGLSQVSGIVLAKKGAAPATQELSGEVQDIVNVYAKGLTAWDRATEYIKSFVDAVAPRLNVSVDIQRVDAFQYFYAYSDYAEQLLAMASSKGVDIDDVINLLELSDEEYALADEYLKMGDNRAMEYMAECYDAMDEALQRMADGTYSVDDAMVVNAYVREIVDVLNVSLSEAGSFDWVANPVDDGSLGFEPVQFDNLAVWFFDIAQSAADSASTEQDVNILLTDAAVNIYSLVPSVRQYSNVEVDAPYVASMRSYLEHPIISELISKMYK